MVNDTALGHYDKFIINIDVVVITIFCTCHLILLLVVYDSTEVFNKNSLLV